MRRPNCSLLCQTTMVVAALYNWVYEKLQRLNSEYATLIRKVQKLGISSSEADRTKALELQDRANSRLEIFATANTYISQRQRGAGLSRDGVVELYNHGFQAIEATKTNKVPAEVRAIFTAIGKCADGSGPDGLLAVALDSESMGNEVRYGDFVAGKDGVKDVVGNLLTVSCNRSRQYVDQIGLGRAELIEQKTFFNFERMRRLGVLHVIHCFIDSIKDFQTVEQAKAAAEAEWRAEADGDEEDEGIADEEDEDSSGPCGNHIRRLGHLEPLMSTQAKRRRRPSSWKRRTTTTTKARRAPTRKRRSRTPSASSDQLRRRQISAHTSRRWRSSPCISWRRF